MKPHATPHPCKVCAQPVLPRSGNLSTRIHSWCKSSKVSRPERKPIPAYRLTRVAQQGVTRPNVEISKGVYRSQALRDSARGEACVSCGIQDGTIVWAHANELTLGKAKGMKCHDLLGNYLCAKCHFAFDCGPASREDKRAFFRECYPKTMVRVAQKIAAGELRL